MTRAKIALITRSLNEPFLLEFCTYYLHEGVDDIYIIDDNSVSGTYDDLQENSRVHVVYNLPFSNRVMDIVYKKICKKYDWVICVDPDEFITTPSSSNRSIRDLLETQFFDVDCVKVPWVMMAFNGREKNPRSILQEITHRWNHDKEHPLPSGIHQKFRCRYSQIEVKSITRTRRFKTLWIHHPKDPVIRNPVIVDSINAAPAELSGFYDNLREDDIRNGFLLCYHYRFVSLEHIDGKLQGNKLKGYNPDFLAIMQRFDYPELVDETLKRKSGAISAG